MDKHIGIWKRAREQYAFDLKMTEERNEKLQAENDKLKKEVEEHRNSYQELLTEMYEWKNKNAKLRKHNERLKEIKRVVVSYP